MYTITARNINDAWDKAKQVLNDNHIVRPSRVGEVWEFPTPVTTVYSNPTERVLFDPIRDCNPFFHLMEALWMLAGRNDVKWLAQFNRRMREFSDDGETFHGAYGHRWRKWPLCTGAYQRDQLEEVVEMLKGNHNERRAVIGMWNPETDLNMPDCKDIPCNDLVFVKIREGRLTITVCCRSNDVLWGAYGANLVHFSMLQEYLAAMIGVPVGPMYQISDSWHAYTERWDKYTAYPSRSPDHYTWATPIMRPSPLVTFPESWDEELLRWMEQTENPDLEEPHYQNNFFPYTAQVVFNAWQLWKQGEREQACKAVNACGALDWQWACNLWMTRRLIQQGEK